MIFVSDFVTQILDDVICFVVIEFLKTICKYELSRDVQTGKSEMIYILVLFFVIIKLENDVIVMRYISHETEVQLFPFFLLKLFLSLSSNHFRSYVKHVTNMWSRPYGRMYEILGLNIVFVSNGMLANIICRLVSSCLKKENTIFKEIAPGVYYFSYVHNVTYDPVWK